jgi:23S rRNA pseudouridine2605 synthase
MSDLMRERIAKFIASSGVCSRREAEALITSLKVKVDGEIISSPALNVSSDNVIEVNGQIIKKAAEKRLWLYYKPVGLITTHSDPENRPTVFEQLPELPRVISVGRLDLNSEGLLLLTNSGEIASNMESPKNKFERVYLVRVYGDITRIKSIPKVITIDGVRYSPKSIKLTSQGRVNSWFEVVLTEGKNREIRRIFEHFGLQVNRLIRTSYGPYHLGNLKPGQYKEVKL